jgi:lipocalin
MSFRSIIILLAILTGCATNTTQRLHLPALSVVPQVDLSRYVGTWYEIVFSNTSP